MVKCLDTSHFVVVEPVGRLGLIQFVNSLSIKLLIVYLAIIVDELTTGNRDTDVSTATRFVLQRLLIVGSSNK